MSEGSVGEEEVIDAGLGKYVSEFRRRATVLSARCGASGWSELATELKSLKEGPPGGVDAGGVGFPGFVKLLQKCGVAGVPDPTQGWGGG